MFQPTLRSQVVDFVYSVRHLQHETTTFLADKAPNMVNNGALLSFCATTLTLAMLFLIYIIAFLCHDLNADDSTLFKCDTVKHVDIEIWENKSWLYILKVHYCLVPTADPINLIKPDQTIGYWSGSVHMSDHEWSWRSSLVGITRPLYLNIFYMSKQLSRME